MKEIGIYIHIPFCKEKCSYCDFISFSHQEEKQERYIKCLIKEIEQVAILLQKREKEKKEKIIIKTIYIGGGTPSYIDEKFISQILEVIKREFKVNLDAEITIEVNPGTVTEEKLNRYRKDGINRISIGLQSMEDKLLKKIGRIHTAQDFRDTYQFAKRVGFDNINVDLMIGLPEQKLEDVKKSVEEVIKLNPEHISVYSLILEEKTRMYEDYQKGILNLPEEEIERKMYQMIKEILEKSGYLHYEISNFAKPERQSKHNMDCWKQKEYLGFGLAAHSYFDQTRFSNTEDMKAYMENIEAKAWRKNRIIHERQDKQEMQKEYMLLGLRKIEGVSISAFKEKFVQNPIFIFRKELAKLEKEDLIEIDLDQIKLTRKGLDLANLVWEEFV